MGFQWNYMAYYNLNLCGIKFPEHSNILCFYYNFSNDNSLYVWCFAVCNAFFSSKMQVLFVSRFFAKHYKVYYIVCGCGFVLTLNKCNATYISILQWIYLGSFHFEALEYVLWWTYGCISYVSIILGKELLCHWIYILTPIFQKCCTNLHPVAVRTSHSCLTFANPWHC